MCVAECDPPCQQGEVCDYAQSPPVCVEDLCPNDFCSNGACCDDVTGECGSCPCEGVICPDGQVCDPDSGECILGSMGEGGGSSVASSGAGTGSAASSGAGTGANGEGAGDANGVWGLATGGGCACEAAGTTSRPDGTALVALGLAMAGLRRRRRQTATAARGGAEGSR